MAREDEIRIIAYQIWEEDGCCHGRDLEHWVHAEFIWEQRQKPKTPAAEKKPVLKPGNKRTKNNKPSPVKTTRTSPGSKTQKKDVSSAEDAWDAAKSGNG